jgi:pimeloyl-ACP methyl ester carboxylesterase
LREALVVDVAADGLRRAAQAKGVPVPEFVDPEEHHVVLGGHRFHYLDWGKADQRPVVFLHGHGLTAHTWDLVNLVLRSRLRCFAPDLRGHGDSEWSPVMDYRVETHAADAERFLRQVTVAPAVLVGMSLGGLVALRCAADARDLVSALVIVDIGPESAGKFRAASDRAASDRAASDRAASDRAASDRAGSENGARRLVNFFSAPVELDSVEEFVQHSLALNPRRDPVLLRGSLLHNLRQLPSGRWTWKYDQRPLLRTRSENVGDRGDRDDGMSAIWSLTERVNCPVLVVRGGSSDILSRQGAADLARRFRDGRWAEVPDAGHSVQGDNPAAFVSALQSFLADIGVID